MSKIEKRLLGLEVSGDLGDRIVYSKRHRMQLVKAKAQPKDVKSTAQLYWRTMFLKVVELWHALSAGEKAEWESRGTAHHMTGYDYFISQALRPNPGIYLPLDGGTMKGDIDMDSNKITGLPDPTQWHHPVNLRYFDDNVPAPGAIITTGYYTGNNGVNRAIPHSLGVTPKIVQIYCRVLLWYVIIGGDGKLGYFGPSQISQVSMTTPDSTNFYVGSSGQMHQSANYAGYPYFWSAIG